MTLYLKYRPQSFADVVGQDHVVTTLEQAIENGRASHAYLFCGTRGTGKTSVARILAKNILLNGVTDDVIRTHMIKGIEEGSFVDLIEIDAASNRGIDNIRELIEKIGFSPAVSKAKVYIIDEVHMLTKEAFNALLKTLEEPPEYAYFILATTELHKVPDTIQSRCQRFLFRRVKDDDIIGRLQYIVDQERIAADREALRAIARHASGSFRDGIALLDQLRSLPKITMSDVTERVGHTSAIFIEEILKAIEKKDLSEITEIVKQIETANVPLDTIAADLLGIIREHMHEAIQKNTSPQPFIRMIDALLQALRDMRASPVPGLALEAALVSLCDNAAAAASPLLTTKESTERPEQTQSKAAVPPATKTPDGPMPKEKERTTRPTLVEVDECTVKTVIQYWDVLLKSVSPPSVRMSLKDATVAKVEGNVLQLHFASSFHREKIADTKASRAVEDALHAIFKQPIRLKCIVEKDAAPVVQGPSTDLAEAAKEVFGGM